MEPSVIPKIVNIFRNDPEAFANRKRELYDLLIPWSTDFHRANQLGPYDFFRSLLDQWISYSGNTANVEQLWEICNEGTFKFIADELKEKFKDVFQTSNGNFGADEDFTNFDNTEDLYEQMLLGAYALTGLADPTSSAEPISFEVNDEVRNFTGRSKELETLLDLFHGTTEYVTTITGMGGIGKSELAKRFAHHLKEEHRITIIWFNGQNRETLQASVNRLAKRVQSKPEDSHSRNMKDSFVESVSTIPSKMQKRKLVIIDNVDEANEGAESLIKAKIPKKDCFFLITSRNVKVLKLAGKIIQLDIFPDEDAQHLVSSSLEAKNEDFDDVKSLCKLLQNFPLALQQAVAYIKEQKILSSEGEFYKISDYVDSFATMKRELLGYELNLEHDYELTTLITWKVTMDKIRKNADIGELAIAILSTIAYFQPDRIHMDILRLFFKDQNVEKAIQLIKTYSLVKGGQKLISIHRLLQQVIQLNTSDNNLEVQRLREINNSIIRILEDADGEIPRIQPKLFIDINSTKVFDTNPLLSCIRSGIRHLLAVWDHNCKHPELITEFKGVPIKIIDIVYPLRTKLRRIDDITYFTKTCYSLFKDRFGRTARESLELECKVVFASGAKMSDRKLKVLDDIYERQTSILGDDNLLNLKLLEKISYSIVCEGCYSSNENNKIRYGKYLYDFLRLREKLSGRGHESTFPVRWKLIEELEGKGPEWVIKLNEFVNDVLPQDKDHILRDIKKYGEDLFKDKKYGKANYIYEAWLHIKGSKETKEITEVKWRLSIIQHCLGLGDKESAFPTFAHAEFGKSKGEFLKLMLKYGLDLYKKKKMVKAKEIYELWLDFKGSEETKEVTVAKWTLSYIQHYLGEGETAFQTFAHAEFGECRDEFLELMLKYGLDLYNKNKWVKAKEIYERWLDFKGTEETEEVTSAKWRLSSMQYCSGDRESALQTLQQAVVGWEDRENQPKEFVKMRSECERGDRKVREGDLEDALRLYARVHDYQNSENCPFTFYFNWWIWETCQKRASVLIQLRRSKEALQILQNEVPWDLFVDSDHKLQIEKNELLREAEEGVRLEEEAAESGTTSPSKRPRLET